MTAHIITPEQHAQIVDALDTARRTAMINVMAARIPECGTFAAIAQNLDWAVAMLKAMQPVEPVGWWDTIDGGDFTYSVSELCGGPTDGLHPLYTPTKD